MEYPRQISQDLKKNFCADVIYDAAHRCRTLALDSLKPAPYFILETILVRIAESWDRPLDVDEANETRDRLLEPMATLLDALATDSPDPYVLYLCNTLVSTYLGTVPRSTR